MIDVGNVSWYQSTPMSTIRINFNISWLPTSIDSENSSVMSFGTAINQQGSPAERTANSSSNSAILTMTSEFSLNFYHQTLIKFYQNSQQTCYTLTSIRKRKRNNECRASDALVYIVYAEGGTFNIGNTRYSQPLWWDTMEFPASTTYYTVIINNPNITTPSPTKPTKVT